MLAASYHLFANNFDFNRSSIVLHVLIEQLNMEFRNNGDE
jgi:hypothetical protein